MMKGDPATSFSRLDSRAMCSSPLPPLIVARPSLPAKEEHTVGSSGSEAVQIGEVTKLNILPEEVMLAYVCYLSL